MPDRSTGRRLAETLCELWPQKSSPRRIEPVSGPQSRIETRRRGACLSGARFLLLARADTWRRLNLDCCAASKRPVQAFMGYKCRLDRSLGRSATVQVRPSASKIFAKSSSARLHPVSGSQCGIETRRRAESGARRTYEAITRKAFRRCGRRHRRRRRRRNMQSCRRTAAPPPPDFDSSIHARRWAGTPRRSSTPAS